MRKVIRVAALALTLAAGTGCRAFCDCPSRSYYPPPTVIQTPPTP
jgi:hypothetical protein